MVFSNPIYTVGIRIKVNTVPKASPPITVMANGAPIKLTYSAVPKANGNIATIVVIAVIRIGRKRWSPAVNSALVFLNPLRRRALT